jgi:hypothetical protein
MKHLAKLKPQPIKILEPWIMAHRPIVALKISHNISAVTVEK